MSELGLTLPQASRYLERLALAGRVCLAPDGVSPRGIRKEAAIAHVLLDHPAGLPWKDIARIVNERGYSELPEDRLDGTYTDSDLIYLCERGTYRHTAFFPVPLSHRQRVLATVRAHLDATTASTNMRNLVLETRDKLQLDYFDLRYLIATFGEAHGLYFDGASARDTVKLDAAAPAVPLRGSILRAFDNAAEPLTAQEVADALKIRTAQFAQQHIEALRQEGKVMRVGRRLFTTVRKATKGVDVTLIEAIITSTLTAAPGPVEEDVFREAINGALHLSHSRFFYGDLARNLARRSSWHVQRTLFAVSPIEVESLTDVFDRSFVATDSDEEILERVAGRVWMSARTRKMVADWVRLRRRQSSPSIATQFAEDS